MHGCENLAGSYNRGEADEEEGFDGGAEGDGRRLGLIFREVGADCTRAYRLSVDGTAEEAID